MKYVLGLKQGMTRVYVGYKVNPVTVIDQASCVVSQVTADGYELALGKKKNPNQALVGKYKALGHVPMHTYWVADKAAAQTMKIGDPVNVEFSGEAMTVNVRGVSKGKGFAGVVKRYKFAGGPRTHGQSDRLRAPGSIGAGTTPGRVLKGKRMAGRMGSENVTVKNKKIVDVRDGFVLISGAVPGIKGGLVILEIK